MLRFDCDLGDDRKWSLGSEDGAGCELAIPEWTSEPRYRVDMVLFLIYRAFGCPLPLLLMRLIFSVLRWRRPEESYFKS